MFEKIKFLFGKFFIGLMIALGVSLLIIFPIYSLKNIKVLTVQSGSMEPVINVGSIVFVGNNSEIISPLPSPKYFANDVITFSTAGNNLVSHRIINVSEKNGDIYYQTKGDANNVVDKDPVLEKNVVGKVVFTLPYLGRIFAFAKKPIGFLTMILIPCLYVIVSETYVLIREIVIKKPKSIEIEIN